MERFAASPATRIASAIFVAHSCKRRNLPHFGALPWRCCWSKYTARPTTRPPKRPVRTLIEALLMEAATVPGQGGTLVEPADVRRAAARMLRHNYPEEQLHESIVEGNASSPSPAASPGRSMPSRRSTWATTALAFRCASPRARLPGRKACSTSSAEVDMSGPIHDKRADIASYLTALFSHVAPLALNASIVFEQEYSGVEGDSASCAELYALLSSLSGLPCARALPSPAHLNQHGEVLPVGGINEKNRRLVPRLRDGGAGRHHGVLVPARNQRHLMLDRACWTRWSAGCSTCVPWGM